MFPIVRDCLLVAVGGAIGSLARYGVGLAAAKAFGKGFPWGTLIVNVAGCFAIGIVLEVIANLESHSAEALTDSVQSQLSFWHKAVAIGFLGGLTTFSTFGADTLREFHGGNPKVALANIAANVVLGLIAVWCGMAAVQSVD